VSWAAECPLLKSAEHGVLCLQAKLEGRKDKRPRSDTSGALGQPAAARQAPPGGGRSPQQPPAQSAEPPAAPDEAQSPPAVGLEQEARAAAGVAEAAGPADPPAAAEGGDQAALGSGVPAGAGVRAGARQGADERPGRGGRRPGARAGALTPSGEAGAALGSGTEAGLGQAAWLPDSGDTAAPFAARRGLKQRKKDYLNRRKARKRGGAPAGDAAAGDRLERALLQDPHRPAFGEQALAPIKARRPGTLGTLGSLESLKTQDFLEGVPGPGRTCHDSLCRHATLCARGALTRARPCATPRCAVVPALPASSLVRRIKPPAEPDTPIRARRPAQANLKRKHWDASRAEARTGARCRKLFQRQLAAAVAGGGGPVAEAPPAPRAPRRAAAKAAAAAGAQREGKAAGAARKLAGAGVSAQAAGGAGAGAARGRQGRGFQARCD
jgi:hypothetical protein